MNTIQVIADNGEAGNGFNPLFKVDNLAMGAGCIARHRPAMAKTTR
jgi:hypothetical protein